MVSDGELMYGTYEESKNYYKFHAPLYYHDWMICNLA